MRSYTKSSNALDVFFVQEVVKIDDVSCNNLSCMINTVRVPHILTSRIVEHTVWLSGGPIPHCRTLALILRCPLDLVRGSRDSEFETLREFHAR